MKEYENPSHLFQTLASDARAQQALQNTENHIQSLILVQKLLLN
jgi:hypothetical protein